MLPFSLKINDRSSYSIIFWEKYGKKKFKFIHSQSKTDASKGIRKNRIHQWTCWSTS